MFIERCIHKVWLAVSWTFLEQQYDQ